MAKSKSKKKATGATVSMKGVETGGRSIRDGWATGKIVEAELTTAKESGNEMFKVVLKVTNGKQSAKVYDNLVLTPNALWKLRSVLEAGGAEIDEDEDMEVTEDDLLDLEEMEVEIVNEDYEGKARPKVAGYAPLGTNTGEGGDDEEEEEDEDEDDKPTKRLKSKKSSKDDDDEEDDEEDDEDDEDEEEDEDDEEDEPPKKKGKKKPVDDEDDEESDDDDSDDDEEDEDDEDESEDDDSDDDDDEDDEPKSKKKGKKSKPKLKAGQQVKFEDDKGRVKKGVITSIDGDTIFVEGPKGPDDEWELTIDEIIP